MEMHALHNWSDGDTLYVKFNIVNHIVISLSMCDIFDVFTVCFRSHLFIRHKLIIRMLFCLFIRPFVCFDWNRSLRMKFTWNTMITKMNWCELQNDPICLLSSEAMALYLGRSKTHDVNKWNKEGKTKQKCWEKR